jgi:hypothetical protein
MFIFLEIAHIRSYYGIEREFDRYYSRLKVELRGSYAIDAEKPDKELLQFFSQKTYDRQKVWQNPDPSVPLELAHRITDVVGSRELLIRMNSNTMDRNDDDLIALEHLNNKHSNIVCFINNHRDWQISGGSRIKKSQIDVHKMD